MTRHDIKQNLATPPSLVFFAGCKQKHNFFTPQQLVDRLCLWVRVNT